jgi:hypothetical protein
MSNRRVGFDAHRTLSLSGAIATGDEKKPDQRIFQNRRSVVETSVVETSVVEKELSSIDSA